MPNYKKYVVVNAEPSDIYNALTLESTAQLWTGYPAVIDPVVDGEFSLWNDSIVGKFLLLEPHFKIVQEWYFGEENEVPSIVTFKFHEHKNGTSIEILHQDIPEEAYEDIIEGWESTYIESLTEFYNEN